MDKSTSNVQLVIAIYGINFLLLLIIHTVLSLIYFLNKC